MILFFVCIATIFTVFLLLGYFLPAYGSRFTWAQFKTNPFNVTESWHPLLPVLLGWMFCLLGIIVSVLRPTLSAQADGQASQACQSQIDKPNHGNKIQVDQAQLVQPVQDIQDIVNQTHRQVNQIKPEALADILEPQAHHQARTDELTKGMVSHPDMDLIKNRPILQKLKTGKNCKACQNTLTQDNGSVIKSRGVELIVFVSQSLGDVLLKDLYHQAQKYGGKLVFRGLIDSSFTKTQQYIYKLGINADIDPNQYRQYQASQVPLIILAQGDRHDKITGNVSVNHALEIFAKDGDLNAQAKVLLKGAA